MSETNGEGVNTGMSTSANQGQGIESRRKDAKKPPRVEIAQILYSASQRVIEHEEVDLVPKSWWSGESVERRRTVKETVSGFRFWARAIGPDGCFVAGESRLFDGTEAGYGRYMHMDETSESRSAHDELLGYLWANGWQPTSFGQWWHDIRLRRVPPKKTSPETELLFEPGSRVVIEEADLFDGTTRPTQKLAPVTENTAATVVDRVGRSWVRVQLDTGDEGLVFAKAVRNWTHRDNVIVDGDQDDPVIYPFTEF